jgi:hypothetical protein
MEKSTIDFTELDNWLDTGNYFAEGGGVEGVDIIGTTKSGKPVYRKYNHMPDFDHQDLLDASEIHSKYAHKTKDADKKDCNSIIIILTPQSMTNIEKIAKIIVEFKKSTNKNIIDLAPILLGAFSFMLYLYKLEIRKYNAI